MNNTTTVSKSNSHAFLVLNQHEINCVSGGGGGNIFWAAGAAVRIARKKRARRNG